MAGTFTVRVVSPERTLFDGEATSLVAPAWDGRVGILKDHAPMIALLGAGELTIDGAGGGSQVFQVAGGVLKVERNQVTVLTEHASIDELPEELRASVLARINADLDGAASSSASSD